MLYPSYQKNETIAAIATPPGEGGVAIVRISGKDALAVANKVFSGPVFTYASHQAHYGYIIDNQENIIDDVLILPMLKGRSYTGEDTVEIHCHGGRLITQKVLDVVLEAGARAALPGEFTFKAFVNGRIDLVQAEAVQKLISAKNEHALDAAENQLQGRLSQKIRSFQKSLTEVSAFIEAEIDFPEEDLEFASLKKIFQDLSLIVEKMEELNATYREGRIAQDGISLCLIGRPNVGKSSLMNALLDRERAIVSSQPGTTRDILEDHLKINGLNFRLMDTAGLRENCEVIEKEGVRRARKAMEEADLALVVLDADQGIAKEDETLLKVISKEHSIIIWNKIDLNCKQPPALDFPYLVSVSAKEKIGVDLLLREIDAAVWKGKPLLNGEVLLTNSRHKQSLQDAIGFCRNALEGIQSGLSPEFIALEMRSSLHSLGKIIGTDVGEDILSEIFSKFCVGK